MKIMYSSIIFLILLSACGSQPEFMTSQIAVTEKFPQASTNYAASPSIETTIEPQDNTISSVIVTPGNGSQVPNQCSNSIHPPAYTATKIPTMIYSMGENGMIWAHIDSQHLYKLYDPERGYVGMIRGDKRCNPPLLPGTTQELCNFEGKLGLLDLLTGDEQVLDIQMPDWVDVTANGQFIVYGYVNEELNEQAISIYDIKNHMQTASIPSISYNDWPEFSTSISGGLPSLSVDGDSLVYVEYSWEDLKYYVYEYQIKINQVQRINTMNFEFAGGLAWAPSTSLLLVGATDRGYADGDIDTGANYLFLFNPDTREITLLTKSVEDVYYDVFWETHTSMNNVWSPDSRRLLVFEYHRTDDTSQTQEYLNLCIFTIESGDFFCDLIPIQAQKFPWVGNATWSPDGNYVVFTTNRGSLSKGELIIYSLTDHSFRVVDDTPIYDGLYWRK